MGDYSQEWAEENARLLRAHIVRTVARLESLAGRYGQLRGLLGETGGAGGPDEVRVATAAGPRLPLRVDVLDTMGDIERFLAELLPLVRGTLRLGNGAGTWTGRPDGGRTERTRAGLLFLASGLAGVYAEDPGLGDDVSRRAWQLERRAGWIFGDRSRAFALTDPCEECGLPSLWVVPERMVIRCGNPACGASRPVDAVLPVHVSG